jgi:hypothetical protein
MNRIPFAGDFDLFLFLFKGDLTGNRGWARAFTGICRE